MINQKIDLTHKNPPAKNIIITIPIQDIKLMLDANEINTLN